MNSLNQEIFFLLHNLSGTIVWFDVLFIFSAKFLVYWMVLAVLAVIALFIYFEEYKQNTPPAQERRWSQFAHHAFFALISAIIAWALSDMVKYVYPVARPFIALPDITPLYIHGGFDAFPSGHAAFSFALAGYIFVRHKHFGTLLLFGAFIVSLSRVIVGIHWPADILAGAFIGIAIALCVHTLVIKLPYK
ncbi:MAG: phosphatase PAP2 family protein [Candidatus Paceibacterota bacterium]